VLDNSNVLHYYILMIVTFYDNDTKKIFEGISSNKYPNEIQRNARKKLYHLHSAITFNDLRIPPGNRLHSLKGKRKGQHAICINDQWRICFTWKDNNAYKVEITDYH